MSDLPPHIIAQADQELATAEALVDKLAERWQFMQPFYEAWELDRIRKVSLLMSSELFPLKKLAWAILAVAVERIAGDGS